jgi:hypothetical protein
MLYAIIGKPGQGKSYFAVERMFNAQQKNIQNLKKNIQIYYENKPILLDRDLDLESDISYTFPREVQVNNEAKIIDFTFKLSDLMQFEEEEQFEEYFDLFLLYNDFINHINQTFSITLANLFPVRQIYSDINGLKIDGVLPAPIDWRSTPNGSILYYDEIRRKPPYNFISKTPSKDPIILGMSEVRHADKDVYLLSQDAEDLNYSLRQLIDKMYFIKRPPQNPQACSVYTFDQWLSRPRAAADSKRDPKKYVEYELVVYKKKIFALYKSASSHTSMKFKINWKVFAYIFGFLILCSLVIIGFMKIPIFQYFGSAISQMTGSEDNSLSKISGKPQDSSGQPIADNLNPPNPNFSAENQLLVNISRCIDQFNLTEQQCREMYDPKVLEQRNAELQASTRNDMQTVVFDYDPNNPYEVNYKPNLQPTDFPRFKNAIVYNGKCTPYSQQGTVMTNVSSSDCFRLANGDRPFDYFQPQQQIQPQLQQQPIQVQQIENTPDLESIAKYQEAKRQGLI